MAENSQQIEDVTKSLRYCGRIWSDRLVEEQKPLARQIASLFPRAADLVVQAGEHALGYSDCTALHVWTYLPEELQVQGPERRPINELTGGTDRPFLTRAGWLAVIPAGNPASVPTDFPLAEQTVWFLPRPPQLHPTLLISERGILCEGAGFRCLGAWLVFFENPRDLWPEGVIISRSRYVSPSWKSTTLGADRLRSSGREITRYRRQTQNLRQFERALCEVAGLPLLETDGTVVHLEVTPDYSLHWLEDGRSFLLPGPSPYHVGSQVSAGSGHILHLRHQALQGSDWWRGRPWTAAGIPLFVFRPGFFGVSIKDLMVPAISYEDTQGLRGRLVLGCPEEEAFWEWQARQERRLAPGSAGLAEILGFTEPGQSSMVNALELFVRVYGPWLSVVETTLDLVDPQAFEAVKNFIERERPAGSLHFLRGHSRPYGDDLYQEIALATGEPVYVPEGVTTFDFACVDQESALYLSTGELVYDGMLRRVALPST